MSSELDQEREARYAIQHKLKGNTYLPPTAPTTTLNTYPKYASATFFPCWPCARKPLRLCGGTRPEGEAEAASAPRGHASFLICVVQQFWVFCFCFPTISLNPVRITASHELPRLHPDRTRGCARRLREPGRAAPCPSDLF